MKPILKNLPACLSLLLSLSFVVMAQQIFIDQLGYLPAASKYVFTDQPADSFAVRPAGGGTAVYRGPLSLFAMDDPASGMTLYRGDFSSLESSGEWSVEVNGTESSLPFTISDTVYAALYRKSLKGFYFQRCGVDLLGDPAGPFYRTRGHVADGFFHASTGNSGFLPAARGWHDAGDYGKYIVNAGITVGTLLLAYEAFPARFAADAVNIPESGNGIPDLLDEVRFELEWILKMQDTQSSGVYFKLTRENFSGFVMPAQDTGTRYVYELSSTASGNFAAVMARAARVYQAFDSSFAQTCLNAAVQAWGYLQAHPQIVPPGGFSNPPGTATGQYGDGDDRDERLWAAAELYLASGENTYHNYYLNHYSQSGLMNSTMSWPRVQVMAHLAYLRGALPGINTGLQNTLRTSLTGYCQTLLGLRNSNGFHVAMYNGDYVWGSNATPLNRAVLLIFGYEETGNALYREAALDQLHYILGVNAHRLSFVTGAGDAYPMFPHHRPSGADGVAEPVPGLLAGGPNKNLDDPVLQAHFNETTPPALCYIDDEGSYGSNEIAINWNAPLVLVSGYFASDDPPSGLGESAVPLLPDTPQLGQNYPNPFNGATVITVHLATAASLQLQIVDVLGRAVYQETLEALPAGEHRFTWQGQNRLGKPVASGLYYYFLAGQDGRVTPVKKMLYIR